MWFSPPIFTQNPLRTPPLVCSSPSAARWLATLGSCIEPERARAEHKLLWGIMSGPGARAPKRLRRGEDRTSARLAIRQKYLVYRRQ
jgi:hypothetical protein